MSFVAAAATVGGAVGLTGTAAIIGGGALIGAGAGGLYSAVTGDGNILNSALTGGLLGATAGGLGAAFGGAAAAGEGAAASGGLGATTAAGGAAPTVAPLTGANVAGNAAMMGPTYAELGYTGAAEAIPTAMGPTYAELGYAPQMGPTYAELGYTPQMGPTYSELGYTPKDSGITAGDVFKAKTASDVSKGEIPGWAKLGAGALGLGYLMQKDNSKYGIGNTAPYTGNSLASFKYDRTKYTPVTTAQPTPYQAQYANYTASPYKTFAAGGDVSSIVKPAGGIVEQMSRDNAVGSNQMFPQANIPTEAFSSPTNRPLSQNVIGSVADTAVDPYTGQEKFARGGLAATKRYADGGEVTPDQITANSVNYNNALMQQLQSALNTPAPQMNPGQVAQQAPLQPVPSGVALAQTPYQAPPVAAPAQYQEYAAPTFTRNTPTPISLDPQWIPGTPAQQAKAAADAAAAEATLNPFDTIRGFNTGLGNTGGAKEGGLMPKALRYDLGGFIEGAATLPLNQAQTAMDNPGQALIGANTPFETQVWNGVTGAKMRPTVDMYGRPIDQFGQLKSYAGGGKIPNHMEAIDNYIAQYQTDPAKVMSKAKSGDYNAMIAINKVNGTPNQNYAAGGHLGSYSDGGRMLKGPGDGMSDNIPATIGGKQPARLADGEFVIPADVVSHLGNGSSDAGAKHLYNMMDKVRKARTGSKKQGKQIKPEKFLKG